MELSSEGTLQLPSTDGTICHSLVSQHWVHGVAVLLTCLWVDRGLGDGPAGMLWVELLDQPEPSVSVTSVGQGCNLAEAEALHYVSLATHPHEEVRAHPLLLHIEWGQEQICLPWVNERSLPVKFLGEGICNRLPLLVGWLLMWRVLSHLQNRTYINLNVKSLQEKVCRLWLIWYVYFTYATVQSRCNNQLVFLWHNSENHLFKEIILKTNFTKYTLFFIAHSQNRSLYVEFSQFCSA